MNGLAAVTTTRMVFVPLAVLSLAACATPETRVRTALVNAGVSAPVAGCMADRMVNRLSLGQLRKLSNLSKLRSGGNAAANRDLDQLTKATKALRDPEIIAVVTSSGLICFTRYPSG